MSGPSGTTMRAWQVNGAGEPIDVLHSVHVDVPDPGPGQIRVRVTAAGIGLPDVLMCRGTYPLTPPLPFTPGQEATGVVTAVGDGVAREIGSRVMFVSAFYEGHGSFAEEWIEDPVVQSSGEGRPEYRSGQPGQGKAESGAIVDAAHARVRERSRGRVDENDR